MSSSMTISIIPEPYPTSCYYWGSGGGSGSGSESRSGNGGRGNGVSLRPKRLDITCSSNSNVSRVYCGSFGSIAITTLGEAYSWGGTGESSSSSSLSSLGRKCPTLSSRLTPKKIIIRQQPRRKTHQEPEQEQRQLQDRVEVQKVAHGENHTVLLCHDGVALAFGDATDGRLGVKGKRRGKVDLPAKVDLIIGASESTGSSRTSKGGGKCRDIACGYSSSHFLLHDGNIIVSHGLTGYNNRNDNKKNHHHHRRDLVGGDLATRVPTTIQCTVTFVSISSGSHHCVAISTQGHVYSWGIADNGRLGHGEEEHTQSEPMRIEYFREHGITAKKVVCGSAHTIVLTQETSEMYSFGWNMYGQCGISVGMGGRTSTSKSESDNANDILLPTKIECPSLGPIMDLSSGFAHSGAISSSGKLFCWGFNECGQAGIGTEQSVATPTQVIFDGEVEEKDYCIIDVSCGRTHSLAVVSHCSIFQYLERQRAREAAIKAIHILRRFMRYALLRIRLGQIVCENQRRDNQVGVVSISSPEEEKQKPSSYNTNCDEDGTSSQCSDSSYSSYDESTEESKIQVECKPIYTSRITEIMNMEDEDIASTAFSRNCNKRREKLRLSKLKILTETVRRREVALMCREDAMSRKIRQARNAAKNEIAKQRQNARLQKRNAKIQQQIQKESERMRNAKKKQMEMHARPKRMSTIRRRVDLGDRKSYRKKIEPSPPKMKAPLLPSRNKNRKLLLQRKERLLRLDRQRAEETMRRKQAKHEEISRHLQMKEDAKREVMKKIEEVNAMRRKESVKHMLAFVKMKEDINPQKPNEVDQSNHSKKDKFMSLRQWHRELAVD